MCSRFFPSLVLLTWVFVSLCHTQVWPVQAEEPVVRAVLFYSPTCPHCHKVIEEDLTPLLAKYGGQLQILGVNVMEPIGQTLYQSAVEQFKIPEDQLGVPTLIVEDVVLVGSLDIPQRFPGLVESYLADGGVDWPAIPGLIDVLPAAPTPTATNSQPWPSTTPSLVAVEPSSSAPSTEVPTATSVPNAVAEAVIATPALHDLDTTPPVSGIVTTFDENSDLGSRLARDPLGNGTAILVLIGMVLVIGRVTVTWSCNHSTNPALPTWRTWAVPILSLVGLGVAGYLAYVETAQVAAVCGPVGDCNTVQQSQYARLLGTIPIGVLGLLGYLGILLAWLAGCFARGRLTVWASLILFAMVFGGTLFSIYLTFLEPFVIGATCAWCLTSAVVMTALLWSSAAPARRAWSNRSVSSTG
jgi:uncharacterized membrane protein